MTSQISNAAEHAVYPGEYVPLPETEALVQSLTLWDINTAKPLVNMDEQEDCFSIEMFVPGVSHEEILIYVHDNILSVIVLNQNYGTFIKPSETHKYKINHFERHIVLPANADAAFASATYRQGILKLYIPKNETPTLSGSIHIIVY